MSLIRSNTSLSLVNQNVSEKIPTDKLKLHLTKDAFKVVFQAIEVVDLNEIESHLIRPVVAEQLMNIHKKMTNKVYHLEMENSLSLKASEACVFAMVMFPLVDGFSEYEQTVIQSILTEIYQKYNITKLSYA